MNALRRERLTKALIGIAVRRKRFSMEIWLSDKPVALRERASRVRQHAAAFWRDAEFSQKLTAYAADLDERASALERPRKAESLPVKA